VPSRLAGILGVVTTRRTFPALEPAVDAATAGHPLAIEGTCRGIRKIDEDLLISGSKTR
jgi:hypothetical protein